MHSLFNFARRFGSLQAMLGFVIPLLAFCGIEGALGLSLLLPLPFARPTIFVCKLTNTQAGRSVVADVFPLSGAKYNLLTSALCHGLLRATLCLPARPTKQHTSTVSCCVANGLAQESKTVANINAADTSAMLDRHHAALSWMQEILR